MYCSSEAAPGGSMHKTSSCCCASVDLPAVPLSLTLSPQALCFDCEEDMIEKLAQDTEAFRGKVVIIR
jgi:hypothetical protein